jgi:hypothetical protein
MRLQVDGLYDVEYDPDGTGKTTCNILGKFVGRNGDGTLTFYVDGVGDVIKEPAEILSMHRVHAKRIQPKIKMGKPRGIYLPTDKVQNPQTGKIHEVCAEEADMLVRSFGYINLGRQFTEGSIPDGE